MGVVIKFDARKSFTRRLPLNVTLSGTKLYFPFRPEAIKHGPRKLLTTTRKTVLSASVSARTLQIHHYP